MELRIGTFKIEIKLGLLDLQAGTWDIYWNHRDKDFVICRGR